MTKLLTKKPKKTALKVQSLPQGPSALFTKICFNKEDVAGLIDQLEECPLFKKRRKLTDRKIDETALILENAINIFVRNSLIQQRATDKDFMKWAEHIATASQKLLACLGVNKSDSWCGVPLETCYNLFREGYYDSNKECQEMRVFAKLPACSFQALEQAGKAVFVIHQMASIAVIDSKRKVYYNEVIIPQLKAAQEEGRKDLPLLMDKLSHDFEESIKSGKPLSKTPKLRGQRNHADGAMPQLFVTINDIYECFFGKKAKASKGNEKGDGSGKGIAVQFAAILLKICSEKIAQANPNGFGDKRDFQEIDNTQRKNKRARAIKLDPSQALLNLSQKATSIAELIHSARSLPR